jgi:hypothetical protein
MMTSARRHHHHGCTDVDQATADLSRAGLRHLARWVPLVARNRRVVAPLLFGRRSSADSEQERMPAEVDDDRMNQGTGERGESTRRRRGSPWVLIRGRGGRGRNGEGDRGGGAPAGLEEDEDAGGDLGRPRSIPWVGSSCRVKRSWCTCHRELGWPKSTGRRRRPWLGSAAVEKKEEGGTRERRGDKGERARSWGGYPRGRAASAAARIAAAGRRWRARQRAGCRRWGRDKSTFCKYPPGFSVICTGNKTSREEIRKRIRILQLGPWNFRVC